MTQRSPCDPRVAQLINRLSHVLPGRSGELGAEATDPVDLDRLLAGVDALVDELTALRGAASRSEKRLEELSGMIAALVSFDYEKRVAISDQDDALDGFALCLNMLAEELAESTVSKGYVNNIIESMHDLLVVTGVDGHVRTVNQAACELLGFSREELAARSFGAIFPGLSSDELIGRGGVRDQESECRSRSGVTFPVSLSASVMLDTHGVIQGLVCVARDLTEGKRLEEERWKLREAMQRQSIILEELSTPLIPITDEILVMPLVGSLDEQRARRMTEMLLQGIASRRARVVILDITGVRVVNTEAVQGIIRAVQAARLIGAQVLLTGIRPDVARTLVELDVDLGGVITFGTLQAAIGHAMRRTARSRRAGPAGPTGPAGRAGRAGPT